MYRESYRGNSRKRSSTRRKRCRSASATEASSTVGQLSEREAVGTARTRQAVELLSELLLLLNDAKATTGNSTALRSHWDALPQPEKLLLFCSCFRRNQAVSGTTKALRRNLGGVP